MRNRVYKYFTQPKWAEAFLEGEVRFSSLAYFRDYEGAVRGDKSEGVSIYRPPGGLLVTNQTQGTSFTMADYAFESAVKQEEVFVFCTSRSLSDALREEFEATACVEILEIPTFWERIRRALPANATLCGGKVEYYDDREGPGARWALGDSIALAKRESYRRQNEYRFVFSLTDALGFEKGAYRLVKGEISEGPKPAEHDKHIVVRTRSLKDICRLHEFNP